MALVALRPSCKRERERERERQRERERAQKRPNENSQYARMDAQQLQYGQHNVVDIAETGRLHRKQRYVCVCVRVCVCVCVNKRLSPMEPGP
jgi:hypothetical protein